jgi:chemotaxis protein CheZ
MHATSDLKEKYGKAIAALTASMDAGNEAAFVSALGNLTIAGDNALRSDLKELTDNLRIALDRFSVDSRLADLAEKEVPDARHRLEHVLKLTDEAAHTTLDLVERSGPLAERTGARAAEILPLWQQFRDRNLEHKDFQILLVAMDAFLPAARADSEQVRNNLAEVLMAQGYQDISGQIIRGVMQLVTEIESVLVGLMGLSTVDTKREVAAAKSSSRGHGPVVPGVEHGKVVSGQQDVDALLSGLGM